jgi:hypothetical protein
MTDQNYVPRTRSITPNARTSTPKEDIYSHNAPNYEIKRDLPKQQNFKEQVLAT